MKAPITSTMTRILTIVSFLALIAAPHAAAAAEVAPLALPAPGWVDRDGDGRHDAFRDANGDGLNDIDGHAYAHGFGWADSDGDGRNDWFCDADGDGVNDLETHFRDRDRDGRDDNVVDADHDGRNDVTGLAYSRDDLHGDAFGCIVDGQAAAGWVDEDGDGFADEPIRARHRHGREDRFVDEDGDGMADGRWLQDGGFRHQHGGGSGSGGEQGGGGHGEHGGQGGHGGGGGGQQ